MFSNDDKGVYMAILCFICQKHNILFGYVKQYYLQSILLSAPSETFLAVNDDVLGSKNQPPPKNQDGAEKCSHFQFRSLMMQTLRKFFKSVKHQFDHKRTSLRRETNDFLLGFFDQYLAHLEKVSGFPLLYLSELPSGNNQRNETREIYGTHNGTAMHLEKV